jgi:hypothetical protein
MKFADDEDAPIMVFSKEDKPRLISKAQTGIDLRRFVLFNTIALVIAVGSNFMQMTSFIMSNTQPEYFRSQRIDELYSINGFNRYYDETDRYELLYPADWLKDRSLVIAEARDRETPTDIRNRRSQRIRPDVAYGPSQGDGKENLSVIKNSVLPGFSLAGTLGEPRAAAEKLLREAIATPESGKVASLIDAYEVSNKGAPVYIFELSVQKGEDFYQHSLTAIASRGNELYTLTFVCPENKWSALRDTANTVVKSFKLSAASATPIGFY